MYSLCAVLAHTTPGTSSAGRVLLPGFVVDSTGGGARVLELADQYSLGMIRGFQFQTSFPSFMLRLGGKHKL